MNALLSCCLHNERVSEWNSYPQQSINLSLPPVSSWLLAVVIVFVRHEIFVLFHPRFINNTRTFWYWQCGWKHNIGLEATLKRSEEWTHKTSGLSSNFDNSVVEALVTLQWTFWLNVDWRWILFKTAFKVSTWMHVVESSNIFLHSERSDRRGANKHHNGL